jgi:hypothetical protein
VQAVQRGVDGTPRGADPAAARPDDRGSHRDDLPAAQERISTWAVKTILVWLSKGVGHTAPEAHYAWLYRHRLPPPGTQVALGVTDYVDAHVFFSRQLTWGDSGEILMVMMTFDHLVIQLYIPRGEGVPPRRLGPAQDRVLTEVWPTNEPALWPPPVTIDKGMLEDARRAFAGRRAADRELGDAPGPIEAIGRDADPR